MKNKVIKGIESYKSVRKSWGNLNPIQTVIQSKKNYSRKQKHKNRED